MTHPIFERFPLADDPVQTSAGPQPTPYHVYDGHIVLIGGTADLAAVQTLLAPEDVVPVRTTSGRTLMGLWVAEETAASHGAHSELQVSFYVSHRPLPPVPDAPFALLHFLLTEPDARQMCHGLWNDTPQVVAYNREVLGLSPRLARYAFEREGGSVRFSFYDVERDALIARGDVRERARPSLGAGLALLRTFGLRGALRAATLDVIELKVVNPVSAALPVNADTRTLSSSDAIVAQLFDPAHDRLELCGEPYGQLGFEPTFVEHMRGFKLVYLVPEEMRSPARPRSER